MNYWNLLEGGLVSICLGTSAFCLFRLVFLGLKVSVYTAKFRERIESIEPTAYQKIFTARGRRYRSSFHPFSIKKYIVEKGTDADPKLARLERLINAPVKYGLLTVLMIPGGAIGALVIMHIFNGFFKSLNQH